MQTPHTSTSTAVVRPIRVRLPSRALRALLGTSGNHAILETCIWVKTRDWRPGYFVQFFLLLFSSLLILFIRMLRRRSDRAKQKHKKATCLSGAARRTPLTGRTRPRWGRSKSDLPPDRQFSYSSLRGLKVAELGKELGSGFVQSLLSATGVISEK